MKACMTREIKNKSRSLSFLFEAVAGEEDNGTITSDATSVGTRRPNTRIGTMETARDTTTPT
eukprot:CAMPEP_0170781900 /NCGR_PEP_ID=MMETSP0733-20121128/14514_1 /TAXON_ID=186038 /ORGANISM="Fragilariopsis kerguelensis, Strain L26-C5" /LENGTH=61 /DNA_ID=CAMNT_0011126107 /DNA_START=383 /DNA_END=568 /DNA_ORIENTATION=+